MKIKKVKTLKALKSQIKKSLPTQISKVMESYEDFSQQVVPIDAKGFSAHHSACKSAVVHTEALLKLAKWTDDEMAPGKDELSEQANILHLISEARQETDEDE